ncbi:MAG: SAM-dependent DNA methyltransferase [Epsilonproteobacteria bacterium]|nr:MAG: SAM-dependent DNA methyltransferase [Campylobacterota bacterium]
MDNQVRCKTRVADHGEVFTAQREVNNMLDLVKQETIRIDSRFLEPACGSGNFLVEVLNRKLEVVKAKYKKSQVEYEKYLTISISSIYGIDILEDNINECRQRLYDIFDTKYSSIYKKSCKDDVRDTIRFILSKNIICGDALTLTKVGSDEPIIFAEWSAVNNNMIKRRDYTLNELLRNSTSGDIGLFSDLGEDAFIPTPVKEYPLIHFLKLGIQDD